jgi:pyrroline-5-carboxylate reductase
MKTRVSIIGYGTMGKAIAQALRRKGGVGIFSVGRHTAESRKAREIRKANFVILAVKPHDAPEVMPQFKNYFSKDTILISILAGVPLKKLAHLSGHRKIIRMMPNLGLSVGQGIAVWKSTGLTKAEKARAKKFIGKITENFEVKNEDAINRATAISASGPAYFFLLADSLFEASRSLGFNAPQSRRLAGKTFMAAAALSGSGDFSNLIKKIASKKGTTEAALKTFHKKGFEKIVGSAVRSAYQRAKELSK